MYKNIPLHPVLPLHIQHLQQSEPLHPRSRPHLHTYKQPPTNRHPALLSNTTMHLHAESWEIIDHKEVPQVPAYYDEAGKQHVFT